MGNIIFWVLLGGISGWLANLFITGKNKGCITNIIIGIIGSVVGGFVFNYFGKSGVTGLNLNSIIVSFVGAVIFLVIVNILKRL